ncbi:MAG: chemotaxis protein CheX [Actinomycetota bacterium]|nr:chemotaxis protein CheX [Actinomycetota bacterium]
MLSVEEGLEEQMEAILADVWSFLGLDDEPPSGEVAAIESPSVHVYTRLSGPDADVGLALQCDRETARSLAAAMLDMAPPEIGPQDISDAMGEIANIIGGNLKALAEDLTLGFAVVQDAEGEVAAKGEMLCGLRCYPGGHAMSIQVTLVPTSSGRSRLAQVHNATASAALKA